jgi:hypothetical protein
MKTKKLVFILITTTILLLLTAACSPDGAMQPEDCLVDEYYDSVDQMCYLEEDTLEEAPVDDSLEVSDNTPADPPSAPPTEEPATIPADESDALADDGMTPEDCFPDEVYDPIEKVCYIEVECETEAECEEMGVNFFDELGSLTDDLLSDNFSGSQGGGGDEDGTSIIAYTVEGDRIFNPQTFPVPADLLAFQQDTAKHQAMWTDFVRMIPAERRSNIISLTIFTDGIDENMAAVAPKPEDPTQWELTLDIVDSENVKEFTYTLIHEYGHLLTLNAAQVPPSVEVLNNPDSDDVYDQAVTSCPQYFTGEGCSNQGAYINLFFNRFWVDIIDELEQVELIEDDDGYYEGLELFYEKYRDQFVTDYAATNSGEDIAESWTHFVLKDKPTGNTIADQKVLFFYDFPELVQLRTFILSQTVSRLRHQQNTQ